MKEEKLFDKFPPITTEQWEEKIKEDLKGASYEKRLVWQTPEGFKVYPYYRAESLKNKEYLEGLPGDIPYIRGNSKTSNHWDIRQDIVVEEIHSANQKALFVLNGGVNSIGFIIGSLEEKLPFKKPEDFSQLMKDIPLDRIITNFICGKYGPEITKYIVQEAEKRKLEKDKIFGSVDYDPLGYLTKNGQYFNDEKTDFNSLSELLQFASGQLPNYKVIGINGHHFNNSGASAIQELGYSLAMASDYLAKLTDVGIESDTICQHMQFNLGVGSSYFMEIAKIRAARLLWARITETYQTKKDSSKQAYIHSITSKWNQTIYDPYANVLRATTEAMAAVIGGTDSLVVRPFTDAFKPATDLSDRVAKNIQIVIREEAYLGNIIDPSAGSYYIENLTDSIITEAWKVFLQVEEQGGYLEALKKGFIQSDISNTAQNRTHSIASAKTFLLGTNQYPNNNEFVKNDIVTGISFPPAKGENLDVLPIQENRGSTQIEQIRLATENHPNGAPKVFLLTYGNQTMRRARAAFSNNFFACGGYEIIDNPGFSSPEEGVASAIKSKAKIVVLCSSDEEYLSLAPVVKNLIHDKAILVVAGAPACMDELKSEGINNFIHLRTNIVEGLIEFHKQLEIKI